MPRIVMKFGGTSMKDAQSIQRVARHVARAIALGNQVAVAVSAMSGQTNQLLELARTLAGGQNQYEIGDETDVVASSGETVSSGLLAIALRGLGLKARSFQGWQAGLLCDESFGKARINEFDPESIEAWLDEAGVAVLAGFQGISESKRIVTLGRGGTDTSAVALAAAIGAQRCDIYTDVDGIYTTDPRIVAKARRIEAIAFEEMLELASLGAKVLQVRCVELAMAKNVNLRVLSSLEEPSEGTHCTMVVPEDEFMEKQNVTGVAYSRDEAFITVIGLQSQPGAAAGVFAPLTQANINVDMIVQSTPKVQGTARLTFTVPEREAQRAYDVLIANQAEIRFERVHMDVNVAKVSIVGLGMRSHAGVAQAMFGALADKGINIYAISTSEIKISVLIETEYVELAVRALHTAFGLDG